MSISFCSIVDAKLVVEKEKSVTTGSVIFHGFYDYDHDKNQNGGETNAVHAGCSIFRWNQDKGWVQDNLLPLYLDENGEVSWSFQYMVRYKVTIYDAYGGYLWIWSKDNPGWMWDSYNEVPLYNWWKIKSKKNIELTVGEKEFKLIGFGLGTAWSLLFLKGRPHLITIGILSMLTSRWQHYGHLNGYLPTNDTEPFTSEQLFVYGMTMLSMYTIYSCFLPGRRTTVLLALAFHTWMEMGYRMGYINVTEN